MALLVELTSKGGNEHQQIPVTGDGFKITAQAGTVYRITDTESPDALQSAQVRRVGDDLVIDLKTGESNIVIVDFYFVCRFDYRSCFLELETLGGTAEERIDAEIDPVQKLSDGSFLVWTAPVAPVATPVAATTSDGTTAAADSAPGSRTESTVSVRESIESGQSGESMSPGRIGAIAGGVAVLAAVAGGGGGGSTSPAPNVGSDPATGGGSGDPTPAPVATTIKADQAFTSATPTIDGTAEAGSTLTLTLNLSGSDPVVYSAPVDAAGNWSVNTASDQPISGSLPATGLPAGALLVSAVATDAAGNSSAQAQASLQIDLGNTGGGDTTAPSAPTVDALTGDDLISQVEARGPIEVSGTAEAGSRISVIWDGVRLSTTADASGRYEVTFPASTIPDAGAYSITVRATDAAGNTSSDTAHGVIVQGALSNDQSIEISAVVDNVPGIVGRQPDEAVINDNTPQLVGTLGRALVAGESVQILLDGSAIGTATVVGANWTYNVGSLDDGEHEFSASVIDASGREIAQTEDEFSVTIDTVAPALPVFDRVEGNSVVDVEEALDGVQITGTSQPGLTVQAEWGEETISGLVDDDGSYELTFDTLPQGIGYGNSEIVVSALDDAGNAGPGRLRAVWVEIREGDLVGNSNELFAETADSGASFGSGGADGSTALASNSILDENQTGAGGLGSI